MAHIFLSGAQTALFRQGIPIFMLHKVSAPPASTRDPFDYMTPEVLDAKLGALGRAGFASVPLNEASRSPISEKSGKFVLTFDDGYRSVFENALTILARHRVTAIQFLVAGEIGRQNRWDIAKGETAERLMNKEQVQGWLSAGHAIGSHSVSHPNLRKLSQAEAREEVVGSKKRLEDTFGVPVKHFSYPSGRYTPAVKELVQEAGYQTACTVNFGVNAAGDSPFELRRISPLYGSEIFAKVCHRLQRKFRRI